MKVRISIIAYVVLDAGLCTGMLGSTGSVSRYYPRGWDNVCFPGSESLKVGGIIAGCGWSWGENTGWLNLKAPGSDVRIGANILPGKAWMRNCGWVSFGSGKPMNGEHYSNESGYDWGVNNDGEGNLLGYGWSELTGWVNFNSGHSCMYIDKKGQFHGYAWGENVGWIHFGPGNTVKYMVKASPGPWRAIGGRPDFRLVSGDTESGVSLVSGGQVQSADLNPDDKRCNQKVVTGFINISGKEDSSIYIRFFERLVHIGVNPLGFHQ